VIPRPLRAVILDFDGVILDSNELKTEAFREVFSRFPDHAEPMLAYHHAHVSQSRYEKFAHLVENRLGRKGDQPAIDRLASDFAAILRGRIDTCAFVPGAREMLEELAPRVPLYLASVTPQPELLRLLEIHRIHRHFVRVFGCPPWTKPEALAAIVRETGGADRLVLVGDSAGDQRAAAALGVAFVARDSGLPFDPPVTGVRSIFEIAVLLRTHLAA
jgi:phosphoglycolate phosphatase-like HAD superfamily hydrolase